MIMKSKIWLFIYMFSSTYCDVCRENCKQTRIQGLYSADCFNRNLREIPECLSSKIEVLDLSQNRIRKISENDLRRYGYLQIVYLTDNVITNISEEAMQDMSELHTLDLSYNVLYSIPKSLFHLPKLRKLYLNHIESPNMVEDIESSRPIESPLTYLDMSYNKLQRLPNLGTLPSLTSYNVSGNEKLHVSSKDFAGLCNLKLLTTDSTSLQFRDPCECWNTEQWLRMRNVTFSSFNCKPTGCPNSVSWEDMEIYNNCRKLHEEQMQKLFTTKLLTNIGIGIGIVCLLLILTVVYIMRRRKQKQVPKDTKILC